MWWAMGATKPPPPIPSGSVFPPVPPPPDAPSDRSAIRAFSERNVSWRKNWKGQPQLDEREQSARRGRE